ncbi:hypothetical protein LAJ19_04135 [Deinococcus taeanensis]|uniref:hypothetical protein n=1 Tax=Deinococcus taeanensis TaxID=2737050 RepID=UPI001CDD433C|nr:hypothetical protein [Deinococcus taeanensis]UBV43411.1 hypothetical protein LAJ19_04135 [Deinococcus taeanensis]
MTQDTHIALMAEGDGLARHLTQTLHVTTHDPARLTLLGRSLALNLVQAYQGAVEHVTRRAGHPIHAGLSTDPRGRAQLVFTGPPGFTQPPQPAEDLLRDLLFIRGRLHPAVQGHLQGALSGSEHHATRALVACLRSPPVMQALERQIRQLLPGPHGHQP